MAEVAPFRGLRYNPAKIPDLANVVIPPYDVISPGQQEEFYRTDSHNMIRLELGKAEPGDAGSTAAHARAAAFLLEWQREQVLVREESPVMYYYELDYSIGPGLQKTRYGFICVLRLEEFSTGAVRPHEKTFQAVKSERLGLMQACHANLSPVFALYSDSEMEVDRALKQGRERSPIMRFTDRNAMEHRVWRVKSTDTLLQVRDFLKDKEIFIADGHHRYETALNYRSLQRERFPDAKPNASFEYIMMYLSSMNQGGLTILPTHRLVRNWNTWNLASFLSVCEKFFDMEGFETTDEGKGRWHAALGNALTRRETAIGFFCQGAESLYLLRARDRDIFSYLASIGVPEVLRHLDVVVLDKLILKHLLALPEMFLDNEKNIHFKHDLAEALSDVQSGEYEAGFFINPTRIEQVQEVASAGLIMPHKSTYFYPKVGSGVVINPLSADEEIVF